VLVRQFNSMRVMFDNCFQGLSFTKRAACTVPGVRLAGMQRKDLLGAACAFALLTSEQHADAQGSHC